MPLDFLRYHLQNPIAMDIADLRDYCLSLPFTEETMPFDDDTLVFKVGGKMYAYTGISDFLWVGVKCAPEEKARLMEECPYAGHASHMSKRHWLGIDLTGDVPAAFLREKILGSYRLVIENMPLRQRTELLAAIARSGFEF